eukprot:TRINITY_DN16479_c0_g1_i1.p2 TRINITY_DN16479_c0_g1~~TRINITY_DN16479_c0_g1_i1.p2  ORF type:complete len:256 (-),score=19.43 TRINITY_DN16479_c0_g1_i1:889-1656(-)
MSKCVRFAGKVAVITASSEGIGFGIALRLCQEGCCVVISSRKQDNVDKALQTLKKVCANANAVGIVCHIGESLQRKNLIRFATETFGKIDILVSNAAVNPQLGGILDVPERVIDKVIDVNIKSAIMLVREAVPYMSDTGANIVFISSVAGYDAFEHLGVYSVSKTALLGLTKTLAKELSSQGIRVNCVAPGTIPTKLSNALTQDNVREEVLKVIPVKRFGNVQEIASTVAFLASDDASYVTGETIVAAGGQHCHL